MADNWIDLAPLRARMPADMQIEVYFSQITGHFTAQFSNGQIFLDRNTADLKRQCIDYLDSLPQVVSSSEGLGVYEPEPEGDES